MLPMLATVTSLWHEVLQSNSFTDDTHFFLAGGDSLQLTRVILKLQQACGIQLQLRDAVEFSTPRKMAAWCEHLLALVPRRDEAHAQGQQCDYLHYRACSMQQGLWLAEQQAGDQAVYNTAALLQLRGRLDIHVLEQALSVLLHKHPVLRSTLNFDLATRCLQGQIAAFQPVFLQAEPVTLIDLPAIVEQRAALRFDLAERMYRFQLFKLAHDHHALLLCCHHAVTDGWSAGVMLQSLAEAYNHLQLDPSWQACDIDTAFVNYCQLERARDRVGVDDAAWWRQQLAGDSDCVQNATLMPARPWPFAMKHWQMDLQPQLLMAIRSLCSRHHVTPFSCLLTALKFALAERTRTQQQLVGFPVAARSAAAHENSIGCYVNTLLTRDVIDGPGLCGALLRRVHSNVQEALLRAIPLQQLIRQFRPTPLPSGNAWFDVLFAFQNLPPRSVKFHGLQTRIETVNASYGQYPVKLEIVPLASGSMQQVQWQLRIEYAELMFDEAEIRELAEAMQRHLLSLASVG